MNPSITTQADQVDPSITTEEQISNLNLNSVEEPSPTFHLFFIIPKEVESL